MCIYPTLYCWKNEIFKFHYNKRWYLSPSSCVLISIFVCFNLCLTSGVVEKLFSEVVYRLFGMFLSIAQPTMTLERRNTYRIRRPAGKCFLTDLVVKGHEGKKSILRNKLQYDYFWELNTSYVFYVFIGNTLRWIGSSQDREISAQKFHQIIC